MIQPGPGTIYATPRRSSTAIFAMSAQLLSLALQIFGHEPVIFLLVFFRGFRGEIREPQDFVVEDSQAGLQCFD
jgi:hypothetical protein